MTSEHRCPEDLLVQARRGELSAEEEKSLRVLLDTTPAARLWYDAGIGFDAESPVLPGDEELVARVVKRVGKASAQPVSRAWWRIALPAAAASLLATTAAAGGWILLQRSMAAGSAAAPSAGESGTEPAETARQRAAAVESRRALAGPVPPAAEQPPPVARGVAPTGSTVGRREEARGLFERANRARREGRAGEAMALYEQLGAVAPRSMEAEQAELALGELNLQRGTPAEALRHFRRYRGQAMNAEALWGEARALRQLGRIGEEREALDTLCRQFPSSPYVPSARKRLGSPKE